MFQTQKGFFRRRFDKILAKQMGNLPEENATHVVVYGDSLEDRREKEDCSNIEGSHMEHLAYYQNDFNCGEGIKGAMEAHTDPCKAHQMGDYETDEYEYEYISHGNSSGSEAKILYQSGEVFTKAEESCNEKSESENNLNRNICEKNKFVGPGNEGNAITWIGDNTQPFECDVCRKRFCTWFGLNKHAMVTHDAKLHNERRVHCTFHTKGNAVGLKQNCNYNSDSDSLAPEESQKNIPKNAPASHFHKQLQHSQNKTVKNKTFNQLQINTLINHRPVHPSAAFFQCDLCGKCFKHKSEFKLHMAAHLQNHISKNKTCEIIPAKKVQNQNYHTRPDFVKCEKCSKVFNGVKKFKQHLGWVLEENMPPGETFNGRLSRGYELAQPSKMVSATYFTYEQPVNAFSERRLPANMQWARPNRCSNYSSPNPVNTQQNFLLSSPNLAKCKHCGKAHSANLNQNQSYVQHRSPRTCSQCGQSFTRLSRMRRRQRLHPNPTRFKHLQAGNKYQQTTPVMNYPMRQVDRYQCQYEPPKKLPRLPTGLRRHKEPHSDYPYSNYLSQHYPNY